MSHRILNGTTSCVVLFLLLSVQPVNAQFLRLKMTGPKQDSSHRIPTDPRREAANESSTARPKGRRPTEAEQRSKIPVRPDVKSAHFESRRPQANRTVTPASVENTRPVTQAQPAAQTHSAKQTQPVTQTQPQPVNSRKETPAFESPFDATPDEQEFELPVIAPKTDLSATTQKFALPVINPNRNGRPNSDDKPIVSQAVEAPDDEVADQPKETSDFELPLKPKDLTTGLPAKDEEQPLELPQTKEQLLAEELPQEETRPTLEERPQAANYEVLPPAPSDDQPVESELKIQPTEEPKPVPQPTTAQPAKTQSKTGDYEEPATALPSQTKDEPPRTLNEEFSAPIHLSRLQGIDVRDATRLKPASDSSPSIQSPPNQAQLILGMRPPVRYGASAWPGLQTNRNTYPFCHKPLYFEDPNLERGGYHYGCLTTPISTALFLGTIPTLPYRHGAEPPWECVRSLPDCRYGHSFGYDAYLPPLSLRGAALQAAAVVGFIYTVP